MRNHQNQPEKFSNRDRQVIDHVDRHRVSTNEVFGKLYFAEQKCNAVTKVTARLCREELLRKHPLYHPRVYFTLGRRSAQLLGVSLHRTLPLGPQALPIEYAALAYTTLGPHCHRRLTRRELKRSFPWCDGRLLNAPHCFNESIDPTTLELIRVDLGGKPDHVARKCSADIRARRRFPEFNDLLRRCAFRLVVITATAEKANAIRDSFNLHVWPDGLQIHLVVVSDLLRLTARSHGRHDTDQPKATRGQSGPAANP